MSKLQNGEEILPKVSTTWVGYTNVTHDRQTTDGFVTAKTRTSSSHVWVKKPLNLYLKASVSTVSNVTAAEQKNFTSSELRCSTLVLGHSSITCIARCCYTSNQQAHLRITSKARL